MDRPGGCPRRPAVTGTKPIDASQMAGELARMRAGGLIREPWLSYSLYARSWPRKTDTECDELVRYAGLKELGYSSLLMMITFREYCV